MKKCISHFSAGATSAIATAIAIREYDECEIIYADTGSEDEDNFRFMHDCEEKLFGGRKVKVLKSTRFNNVREVFEHESMFSFRYFAPCTKEMKKFPIRDYLGDRMYEEDHIFGFDANEQTRADRFVDNNHELPVYFPLLKYSITKGNALALLDKFGVEMPRTYRLGYTRANCIGCVKAQTKGYWAGVREDYPDIFDWYAKFERKINRRVINDVWLDELPQDVVMNRETNINCGYSCGQVFDLIEHGKEVRELTDDEVAEFYEKFF